MDRETKVHDPFSLELIKDVLMLTAILSRKITACSNVRLLYCQVSI